MLNGSGSSGASSSAAVVSLASASNLIRHVTEIHAILNNDETSRSTSFGSKAFVSQSSDSSSSPITVLLTNERDDPVDDVISELSDHPNIPQPTQNHLVTTGVHNQRSSFSPTYPQSRLSQPSRVIHPSRQDSSAIQPLKRLKTTLWIDRALLITGVIIPLSLGVCFLLVHAFTDFSSCRPVSVITASSNRFINQVCRAKLIQLVLQGAKDADNEERVSGSLQHECFPIIIILTALLNLIPHICWRLAVKQSIYRDASLVAGELRTFRRTAQRELIAIASNANAVPITSNYMPMIQELRPKQNSNHRLANRHSDSTFTEGGDKFPFHKMETGVSPGDTGYESEMDLPSAAVLHLPRLRVSRDDHALNLFLSGWQNTDYYIRRFLAKHLVLALFNTTTFGVVAGLSAFTRGEPFSGRFYCRPTEKSTSLHVCLASTTFALNMSAFCLGGLALIGLICAGIFFQQNFTHSRVYKESTLACGTKFNLQADLAASLVSRRNDNFFSDYIRLLSLARMQQQHGSLFVSRRDIFSLRLSYLPGITRTDFHFINLICKENSRQMPDAMQLRVWLLRYVFLCRRLGPSVFSRTVSTPNHRFVKSEDLSTRLGFNKVRVQVESGD